MVRERDHAKSGRRNKPPVTTIVIVHNPSSIIHQCLSSKLALQSALSRVNKLPPRRGNDEYQLAMTESTLWNPEDPPSQPPSHQASTSSTLGAVGFNLPNQSRAASAARSVETQKTQSDTTTDKATAAFIRRVLCSHNVLLGNGEKGRTTPRPIQEVLPPLTSSNEVDLQLYGIISVIIKEFVQTWYSKITPDHVFVNEVIQIIAHCTRALEQRLRKVDLEALLLDEIPELIEAHLSCR